MTGGDMPRLLSDIERGVIARLLAVSFPGRDELRAQLPFAIIVGQCGCGCATVNLAVDRAAAPAPVLSGAPVSADISDGESTVITGSMASRLLLTHCHRLSSPRARIAATSRLIL